MNLSRYFHTLRHLRPGQVTGRLAFRLRRPAPDTSAAPPLRPCAAQWTASPHAAAQWTAPLRFRLLNVEREIVEPGDWNHGAWEKLWLYNLHYFDALRALPDGSARRELMTRWLRDNPACEGVGWEPYPTSLRIVNWIKSSLGGGPLAPDALHSLAVQARHLSRRLERHLLGNHLLANAKALVFSGAFFAGAEAARWLRTGLGILEEELAEQVLADGGHFERSPMYHSLVLEDVLDLVNLASCQSGAFGPEHAAQVGSWRALVPRMLAWLGAMTHPDGQISFFNDAAFDVAASPGELRDYAERLIRAPDELFPATGTGTVQCLSPSGYASVRCGPAAVIFDAAPVGPDYLPGHAHADTLSFELSWGGARVICNSGTSCYGTGAVRQWERSTGAHNTVMVDGEDSSEVWSGFRVARRARPFGFEASAADGAVHLAGSHDGYTRLRGRPLHRREIRISDGEVSWRDEVAGRGTHVVTGHVPIHPDVAVRRLRADTVALTCPGGQRLELAALDGTKLTETRGTYAPRFGTVIDRPVLRWEREGALPLGATLRIREC